MGVSGAARVGLSGPLRRGEQPHVCSVGVEVVRQCHLDARPKFIDGQLLPSSEQQRPVPLVGEGISEEHFEVFDKIRMANEVHGVVVV